MSHPNAVPYPGGIADSFAIRPGRARRRRTNALRVKLIALCVTTLAVAGVAAATLPFGAGDATVGAPAAASFRPIEVPDDPLPVTESDPEVLTDVLALSVADSLLEETYRVGEEERVVKVGSGDTLLGLLTRHTVARLDAHAAVDALEAVYDPRRLQIGQEIKLMLGHKGPDSTLTGLELMPDVETVVRVERDEAGGFAAREVANDLETRPVAAGAVIASSLYAAANDVGVPDQVMISVIRAFAFKVDFQRDLQPGDSFELLFERDFHTDGSFARNGEVLYAALRLGDRVLPMYRFETADGTVDYFDRDGQSVRRMLLRTPVDSARISSGFGMRRHPILGYSRMHRGVDFAAPTGTPIFAAGDGVVESIGRNSGYGNYIRLRHANRLKTAYGHMNRFARGLKNGDRVEQGQVIGYVGSTGLSTGPHLHYEVMVDGAQVNPLSVDLPTGRTLEGGELAAFRAMVERLDDQYAALLRERQQVAATPDE